MIPPGVHTAPQGELHATAQRIQGWADRLNAMRELGITLPVAWGHQPDAMPDDGHDKAVRQYRLSRYNAGDIERAVVNPKTGALEMDIDVPGAERDANGRLVAWARMGEGQPEFKTAIGEVSAKVFNWKDGQDRQWNDSIMHLALTPLPVVTGQKGFQEVPAAEGFNLSTLSFLCELGADPMADEKDKKENPFGKDEDDAAEAETPVAEATPPPPEVPTPALEIPHFAEALAFLAKKNIHLPPGTNPENIWERLCVLGHQFEQSDEEDEDSLPGAANGGMDQSAPVQEAPKPIMMSTIGDRDPVFKRMFADNQVKHKVRALKSIKRLVKTQVMPTADASRLEAAFNDYELSTTADGSPIDQSPDMELSIWERVAKVAPQTRAMMATNGSPAPRPDDAGPSRRAEQEEVGNELAELAGARPTKK